jgi:hypothetical protein
MDPPRKRASHNDWALTSIVKRRTAIDSTPTGQLFKFRFLDEDGQPKKGFGTALHHYVPRTIMSSIAKAFTLSQATNSKVTHRTTKQTQTDALAAFLGTVNKIAAAAKLDTQDLETILHNLPLNLHYGPAIVKDDPGEGFDSSTRWKDESQGERELEPTSAALLQFYNAYWNAVAELTHDSNGAFSAQAWTDLAAHLTAAYTCYLQDPYLIEGISVRPDQWLRTDTSDTWAKRGLNRWPSLAIARERFREHIAPVPANALPNLQFHNFTVADSQGVQFDFRIGCTGASIRHICNRHTYLHFDPTEIKLMNSFFPAGTDQPGVIATVLTAFQLIEIRVQQHLLLSQSKDIASEVIGLLEGDGLTFCVGNLLMSVTAHDTFWNDNTLDGGLELVMLTPTGSAYESYDAALLASLKL